MSKAGYTAVAGADVGLVAATAKSILGIRAGATFGLDLISASVFFDGTAAGNEPVLCELCYATFATNPPGTASTSVTPAHGYGRVIAHGMTAARDWTTAPTVLTVLEEMLIHPQAGVVEQFPLSQSYDSAVSEGFVIRCTAPNIVNARGTLKVERC